LIVSACALGGWAAVSTFFATVTLLPARDPAFDSESKGRLALLFFPGYYLFALLLLGAGGLLGLASRPRTLAGKAAVLLAVLGAAVQLADWVLIYRPIEQMTRRQVEMHEPLPQEFRAYHLASQRANLGVWCLSVAAAAAALGAACAPVAEGSPTGGQSSNETRPV
jgi:hypothetical protein